MSLQPLGGGYWVGADGSRIGFGRTAIHDSAEVRLVVGADPTTFRPLGFFWGADARSVFHQANCLKGADPKTFKPLNYVYGRDKGIIYRGGLPAEHVDPDSFEVLDSGMGFEGVDMGAW